MKNIILIVIFLVVVILSYNRFNYIHTNYCCDKMAQLPLLICSSESPKLVEFEVLGFVMFFCGAGVLFEIFHLLTNIFKEDKKTRRKHNK